MSLLLPQGVTDYRPRDKRTHATVEWVVFVMNEAAEGIGLLKAATDTGKAHWSETQKYYCYKHRI